MGYIDSNLVFIMVVLLFLLLGVPLIPFVNEQELCKLTVAVIITLSCLSTVFEMNQKVRFIWGLTYSILICLVGFTGFMLILLAKQEGSIEDKFKVDVLSERLLWILEFFALSFFFSLFLPWLAKKFKAGNNCPP